MDSTLQTMITNMPDKTGRSLDKWKQLLKTKTFTKHSEAVKFHKNEYQITHGFANAIVSLSKEEKTTDLELIENQFKRKEQLCSLYDQPTSIVKTFGKDVIISPKKTTVSLRKKKAICFTKTCHQNEH
ncbi:DUF4287 domain-containing protein [Flavobacteriaceae bacterium F08102]|nr:DUF4287 domain-containing protein [Flavobacteriaceae bacterium F08102]